MTFFLLFRDLCPLGVVRIKLICLQKRQISSNNLNERLFFSIHLVNIACNKVKGIYINEKF